MTGIGFLRDGRRRWRTAVLVLAALALVVLLLPNGAQATFPGVNGKIVFSSSRDGNYDIYVMNADGSNQTRLTYGWQDEEGAVWSPDGQTIAFSKIDGPIAYGISLMNADGSNIRPMPNAPYGLWPAWSPDGGKLAYFEWDYDIGGFDIWVINIDGTGKTRLTTHAESEMWPNWSPDGTKIVYNRRINNNNDEIYVMNADGSNQTRLTANVAADYKPTWSPDGSKIAFTSTRSGNGDVWIMNADGSGLTNLTNSTWNEQSGTWSPDGTKFIYESQKDSDSEIYAINIDGSNPTRLTSVAGADNAPDWQRSQANLTIEKFAVNAIDWNETFHFNSDIPGHDSFSLTTLENGYAAVTWQVPAGSYSITENPINGWELIAATCDNGDEPDALALNPGQAVTCTFRNSGLPGHLTVVLDTDYPSDQVFHFAGECPGFDNFNLVNDGTGSGDRLSLEITEYGCYLQETIPSGWNLVSATCDDGQSAGEVEILLGENITCTFRNEVERGSLTVQKQTTPAGGQGFPFTQPAAYLFKWSAATDAANFKFPDGVVVDAAGNVYVAEFYNHRIQKFNSHGTFLSTWGWDVVRGNAETGLEVCTSVDICQAGDAGSGDGQLAAPYFLTIDGAGYLYVADSNNHRIQKFTTDGAFVLKWGSNGSGDGQFEYPEGVATDRAGNVYVTDSYNHRIQKFTSAGAFLTKWGGGGSGDGQFSTPYGLAADSTGHIYVADAGNNRIQKFDSGGTFLAKWGSIGAGDGQLNGPQGVAVDSVGTVFVTDSGNSRIQRFSSAGAFLSKWGTPGSAGGQFNGPTGIDVSTAGVVYIADSNNNRVQKFDGSGTLLAMWGAGGNSEDQVNQAFAVAVGGDGLVYVADQFNHRIRKYDAGGAFLTQWGGPGSGDGQFATPSGVAVDADGNVYVADNQNHRIQKFDANGGFLDKWGGAQGSADGQFSYPYAVAADQSGYIYVADFGNARIQKFDADGNFVAKWGSPGSGDGQFIGPVGVATGSGRVYVSDYHNYRIQAFDENGVFQAKWGSQGSGDGQFEHSWGVAVDAAGHVYVTDEQNHRLQLFDADGGFLAKWGGPGAASGQFSGPLGVAVGPNNLVYVADTLNNRVQVFNPPHWATLGDGQQQTFSGLFPGTYAVSEALPAGWGLASATCSSDDAPTSVVIDPGENVTCMFSNVIDAAPVAVDDSYVTAVGQALTIAAPGVLGNDTDADGNPLTAALVDQPAQGSVNLNPNGGFVYTPPSGYAGPATFTYRASDGFASSNVATVRIKVNAAPVAVNDLYQVWPNGSIVIGPPGVLSNDSDANADALTASVSRGPFWGQLTLISNGRFTYTPVPGFVGVDTFTYRASDGITTSQEATVTLVVDRPPVAQGDSYTARMNTALTVSSPGVLANDSDPDGSAMYARLVSNVSHGTLTLNSTGYFQYTPAWWFTGMDSFTYRVSDLQQHLFSNTVEVRITVVGLPVPNNDSYGLWEDQSLTVYPPGILGNDSSPAGSQLHVYDIIPPQGGNLTLYENGYLYYQPVQDFYGWDYFRYQISDGVVVSPSWATVHLWVEPINDPPMAFDDSYRTRKVDYILQNYAELFPGLTVYPYGILVNDRDPDTAFLESYRDSGPYYGSYTFGTLGDFWYKPKAGIIGTDRIYYYAWDGHNRSNTASVWIEIYDPTVTRASGTTLNATAAQSTVTLTNSASDQQSLLVSGGNSNGQASQANSSYNTATGQSQQAASLPESRAGQSAYSVSQSSSSQQLNKGLGTMAEVEDLGTSEANVAQDLVILIGGVGADGQPLASTALYDPATDAWIASPDMSEPRDGFGSAQAADGSILIAGGFNGTVATASVDRYDPAANTMVGKAAMNLARMNFALVRLGSLAGVEKEYFLAIGGRGATSDFLEDVEVYDPVTNTWSVTGSLNIARAGHTATTLLDGRVLVVGGETADGPTATAEIFDPATGQWALTGSLSAPLIGHTATLLPDGTVLVIGDDNGESLMAIYSFETGEWYPTATGEVGRQNHTATLLDNGQVIIIGGTVSDGATAEATLTSEQTTGNETDLVEVYLIPPEAYVTVVKETDPLNREADFDFTSTMPEAATFSLDGGADADAIPTQLRFGPMAPGEYTITELAAERYAQAVRCDNGEIGVDSVTLNLSGGEDVTCTFTNTFANTPPEAQDDLVETDEDTAVTVDVLSNDFDAEDDPMSAEVVGEVLNGALTKTGAGTFTYTPAADWFGGDSFVYQVCDSHDPAVCDSAIVTITVKPVNDPPVTADDVLAVTAGTTAELDLLSNDSDIDSGSLSVVVVTNPTHGTLTVDTGSIAYTPDAGFAGVDSFTYRLNDGTADSNIATVTIQIYTFTGFFPPVDNPPMVNKAKAGSAIPVKFSLGGDRGLGIIATGYPLSKKIACDSGAVIDGIEVTVTAGSSSLQYDPLTGQYTYVWKTDKTWTGTCRQFELKLADGMSHMANLIFK